MDEFQWGIPITDPDEVARIEARLREFRAPGEPIPESHRRRLEEISGRKIGVAYSWPDACVRIEGL